MCAARLNVIEITGNDEIITRLLSLMKSEENDFDFYNILPYPDEFSKPGDRNIDHDVRVQAEKSNWEWRMENLGTPGIPWVEDIQVGEGKATITFETTV